jgi:D-alanyl-D-alanine dipeptidase
MKKLFYDKKIFYIFLVLSFIFIVYIFFNKKISSPSSDSFFEVSQDAKKNVLYLPISDKRVKRIKIKESKENLIDLRDLKNSRILHISEILKDFKIPYDGCFKVRIGVKDRLERMLRFLPPNIGIAYSEGFRPIYKQKEYFDKKFLENFEKIKDLEKSYEETCKSVSPFIENIPTHCTGAAIDMTLFQIKENGEIELLDLGMFDTIYGENFHQETFSRNVSQIQMKNRMLLLESATKAGFVNYGYEYWHFSFGDKAYSLVKGVKFAIYGLVVDSNDEILNQTKKSYFESFQKNDFKK